MIVVTSNSTSDSINERIAPLLSIGLGNRKVRAVKSSMIIQKKLS